MASPQQSAAAVATFLGRAGRLAIIAGVGGAALQAALYTGTCSFYIRSLWRCLYPVSWARHNGHCVAAALENTFALSAVGLPVCIIKSAAWTCCLTRALCFCFSHSWPPLTMQSLSDSSRTASTWCS